METTLSSKGQIVVPRQIRQNHGWQPGLSFTITEKDDSIILVPISAKKTSKLEDVIGCVGYHGKKKSFAQMDAGILEEAKRQAHSW